jgi:hypothetical protein
MKQKLKSGVSITGISGIVIEKGSTFSADSSGNTENGGDSM